MVPEHPLTGNPTMSAKIISLDVFIFCHLELWGYMNLIEDAST